MHGHRNLLAVAFLIVGWATIAGAQENPTRRLESVTWNPVDHKLTWTVSKGAVKSGGKFETGDKTTYEIDMDAATMTLNGEDRRFSKSEAVSVHALMDLVSKYAAESTLWWDAGQGEPLDHNRKPQVHRDHDNSQPSFEQERPRREPPSTGVIRISVERAKPATQSSPPPHILE